MESEVEALREAARGVLAGRRVVPRAGVLWGPGLGPSPDLGVGVLVEDGLLAYEGTPPGRIAAPVRVMRLAGVEFLILTGTCTAVSPDLAPGDLVLLDDQINLTGSSPLVGPNLEELGPRFPDMSEPFDRDLRARAVEAAAALGIPLRHGVYAGVVGPNLETPGEVRMLRTIGADVVGMSVIPEVIAARHMSMRVLGLVVVVGGAAPASVSRLASLVREIVREIA